MKKARTPAPRWAGNTDPVAMAMEIERIRKTDPRHYAKIMRKLAELRRRNRKVE